MVSTSVSGFLRSLFRALEEHQVRYCVLHSYQRLPDELTSDLDMALHPSDIPKLRSAFSSLHQTGYYPLQCVSYSAGSGGSHYFVFGWFDHGKFTSVAVDFTCEHREGGVILMPGEDLIQARRKLDSFWIPDPAIEFRYMLAKKILKGFVGPEQAERLSVLARDIGREAAEQAAGYLVGEATKSRVVDACLNGALPNEIAGFRRKLALTTWKRDPLNRFRYYATEGVRLCKRVLRPTGLFVAVLGPDGVGKSTLLPHLTQRIGGCFRRHKVYHWRPQLLWRSQSGLIEAPHSRPGYSRMRSVLHLIAHALDFSLGYWLLVHPARVQTGLTLFDRYFDDILVDPKRYRYGGPPWLPRLLHRVIPKPDVLLILDAPGETVLARKQELGHAEMDRQVRAYSDLAYRSQSAFIIDASGAPEVVAERAVRALSDYLLARFHRDHGRWVQDYSKESSAQLQEATQWLASGTQEENSRASSTDTTRLFAVVPSSREPRWIIPLQKGPPSLAAMRICTPYRNRARLFKNLVLLALKLPTTAWPGDVISLMADGPSPLETLAAERLGERHASFSISFGTSGRHRKLTVQVMNASGEVLAYIKIPMTGTGNDSVRHEASVLRKLASHRLLRNHIPTLLFAGEWQDRYILIEDALPGSGGPARLTNAHFQFLQTLWDTHPTHRSGEDIVDEVSEEWEAIRVSVDLRWKQLAQEALLFARRRIGGMKVPCGVTHGDFAPWNTRTDNGNLGVFDWECAGWSQPIWWDIFHFQTQASTLLKRPAKNGVPGADHPAFHTMYMMYLLWSTCRIVRDEPTAAGGLQYRKERLVAELRGQASGRRARLCLGG